MNSDACFAETALAVLRERYLRHAAAGGLIEDPRGMLRRVAAAIAAPARVFGEDMCCGPMNVAIEEHRLTR